MPAKETRVSPKIEIEIADVQQRVTIRRPLVKRLVKHVLTAEGVTSAHIEIAFVDDPTIHRVNRDHLQHDYPTDVVTFPYSSDESFIRGEIVISTDHASDHAPTFDHSPEREALLYVTHGLLHLVGYDDHRPHDKQKMHQRQDELLEEFLPRERPNGAKPRARAASRKTPRRKRPAGAKTDS